MLRLNYWSDLHLEFIDDPINSFKSLLDKSNLRYNDGLILAGDILPLYHRFKWESILELAGQYTNRVFYCPGNHCFYGKNLETNKDILDELNKSFSYLKVLQRNVVFHVKGYKIIGTTGWYTSGLDIKDKCNDFTFIPDIENWVISEAKADIKFLTEQEANLIVTHHMPSHFCVNEKYKNSDNQVFYVNNWFDKLNKKPKAIIFGHTHNKFYGYKSGVLLTNNPLGYPWENKSREAFNPNETLII